MNSSTTFSYFIGHCRRLAVLSRRGLATLTVLLIVSCCCSNMSAAIIVTKKGFLLEGNLAYLSAVAENPLVANVPAGGVDVKQVVMVDDGLRRTFLSWLQIQEDLVRESDPNGFEKIKVRQNVASGRRSIGSVTSILNIGPFDRWGRRTFSILTPRGQVDIVQGITEVTPIYTRVEGLNGVPAIRWDCRVATSSIPRETISQVLRLQGAETGADARMQAVRLLFEAERYQDAQIELEDAMREFPELEELKTLLVQLKQYAAQRMIDEIVRRRDAGQHQRVRWFLENFPEEGVATEKLLQVNELVREYQQADEEVARLASDLEAMVSATKDPAYVELLSAFQSEIAENLTINSVERLQDYLRLASDPQMLPDSRLALYVSGWVLGAGSATQNLVEAMSVLRARDLVLEYLNSQDQATRARIVEDLGREEGGTPTRLAQILRQLNPPTITEPQENRAWGHFSLAVPGVTAGEVVEYEVQLPDEYDPHRRYPAIVTLHGTGREPEHQIDWWAGAPSGEPARRQGQSMRHGYIVIAPRWLRANQRRYEYSGREHAAVLFALRDACRRFSIDTDRVFLSGHSVGGDAAWDIGLAHPDLWAGVIPIVATADYGEDAPKYVSLYWENIRHVPFYFVMGELDGNKLELNRRDFDRYVKRNGIDVIIAEYIGRGHEHFYDEIHRLFDWMSLYRRDFYPTDYSYSTMRSFDNFCWNLELQGLPEQSVVPPLAWPAPARARPAVNEFRRTEVNTLRVSTGAEQAWLWLSPDLVELTGRLQVNVNGRTRTYDASPSVVTLLEDARTRVDRAHPFWTRIDLQTGRRSR